MFSVYYQYYMHVHMYHKLGCDSVSKLQYVVICNLSTVVKIFAVVVHVSNHWILVQATAHAPVPNFDMP